MSRIHILLNCSPFSAIIWHVIRTWVFRRPTWAPPVLPGSLHHFCPATLVAISTISACSVLSRFLGRLHFSMFQKRNCSKYLLHWSDGFLFWRWSQFQALQGSNNFGWASICWKFGVQIFTITRAPIPKTFNRRYKLSGFFFIILWPQSSQWLCCR